MAVRLSVNINKIALIRNARGANFPNLIHFAQKCEDYGAQGITVHPRPDERHIRFSDLQPLKDVVRTEFNIEGYPSDKFIQEVISVQPHQVTLVPDAPNALTSNAGWDTQKYADLLGKTIQSFKEVGIRVSLFMEPNIHGLKEAKSLGADRVEFYTGVYAQRYDQGDYQEELQKHKDAAHFALELGLGINAGHDLNLRNLQEYGEQVVGLDEVSIGHALVVDALEFGLKNSILMYRSKLSS